MERTDTFSLSLAPLSEDDPLFARKQELMHARNLSFNFQIQLSASLEEEIIILDQIVRAARIVHLDEMELYFVADDEFGPFSPRNELESLNSVLSILNHLLSSCKVDEVKVLQILKGRVVDMINSVGFKNVVEDTRQTCNSNVEQGLLKWGENNGVKTKLEIYHFERAGRGLVALEDINIGETVLEIPDSFILCEDLLYDSDMFDVLKKLDGITAETMLLLWSMKERYNGSSKFKVYFETLPEHFNTGLSFGIHALTALEGTLIFEEILQAREHLRKQYDSLCPALCINYPMIFQPELYTWEQFLWACELWYSNSMKVVFTDGKLRMCLVPIAGLLNHSLCPHILHYGRVDPETNSLKFKVSRPCKIGEQCYLSYGSFPSSHLLTFYGFLPKGDNPYDCIPLDFNAPAEKGSNQSSNEESDGITHMVRGTWFSNSNKPPTYGFPSPLIYQLLALLKDDDQEQIPDVPTLADMSKDNEMAVLKLLVSIFNPMIEELGDSDDFERKNSSWDVKLALEFKDLQRRIISSVLSTCSYDLQ